MSQFDEINGFEGSCSAQLAGVLQMPTRIDIPTFQNSSHDLEGSNHTTPLNYMRGRGTPKAVQKPNYNQGVSYSELQEDREIELDSRFSHLQLSSSVQDNFFEFQSSASEALEALEPSKDTVIGSLRRDSRVSDGSWEYNRTRDSDPERYDMNGGSQLNLNSNGEFSLQPERRFENQFGQQLSSSPKTEQQGLGMMSNNPGSYLVIAPQDSSQYASELDGRRNTPSSQYQQQSLYGAPSQGVYSSTAITPRELWNQQQQSGVPRRSVPATPSVLSSYATASAQPPSALNKYLQGPPSQASPYHSQGPGLGQGMGQGEYGPAARSPHYGDERERGQLLGERSSPLYPETRGLSPKYASNAPVRGPQHQQLQHQSPAGYYPPQQAPSGYGAPQHHQQHHQHQQQGPYGHMPSPHNMPPPPHHHSAAGYYPPGSQMAPPAIQPDLMFQVQFKRISKCYTNRSGYQINVRDFVVVEGDRGEDIGVVIEVFGMQEFLHRRMTDHRLMGGGDKDGNSHTVDCILRLATMHERQQLPDKFHTEKNIIQSCNELAMYGFGLPIMVYDAEFQFDRNKLTIYYECNVRIDFRDFVRQLYSTYKARIWMKIGNMNTPLEVQPLATMALATGVQFSNGHNA